ncbi:MAG: 4-hydroxythreonine-4-phosphate dehydrogenase PdxA [Pseudomonadota bacterium]
MKPSLAPLALTMGEPGGVGLEITRSAWRTLRSTGPVFYLIDDPDRISSASAPVETISSPSDAHKVFTKSLPVLPVGTKVHAELGVASPQNAAAVISAIETAVAHALSGEASAVVTNPIQKSALLAAGFRFPGHTEFLAHLTEKASTASSSLRGPVMMLAGPELKTVPVTIHRPLAAAISELTASEIVRVGRVVADALARDFSIERPRLAISGLNPHAGEAGALGQEDAAIVAPAVVSLKSHGIDAVGPLPADTLFHAEARSTYDTAICMYHDQALIPAKTLAFHDAVNVTLGLPIIRTSPDHGTALDIAGKGVARADSLLAALRLAAKMAAARASAQ